MNNIKRLFQILGEWKWFYVLSGILLIFAMFIRMLEPKILQITVDKVIVFYQTGGKVEQVPDDSFTVFLYSILPEFKIESPEVILISLGILFLVISLMRGIFAFSSSAITASSTEKATKNLRLRLFSHIQALPLAYHSKTPTGELVQRCTGDVETLRKFAATQVVDVIRMIAIFAGAFIMMASIDLTYAFVAILFVPVILIGTILFFKKESQIWTEHELRQDKLSIIVQENLSGIRVVKAFAKENFEIDKFTKQNLEKRHWGLYLNKLHRIFWPSADFLVHTQIAISIFYGGYLALNGKLTVGEYMAFYSYSVFVTWPMRRLGQLVSEMGMATVAINRIFSILETEKESYEGKNFSEKKLKGDIEFQNVSFNYEGSEKKRVLNNISFKVKAGEKIALLGPTGAGKTTIISQMLRFFDPDSGKILIDGIETEKYSKEYLRSRFGVVLQKPFLFSTTIRDNIAYSKPDSHIDEVIESASAARIHEIITEVFPESYETVVGEKGVTLSGGQKQRVAIARTLLKDPDILILDDSTSAIDSETEFEIQQKLRKLMKGKTTFIIAHRITSIQDCDRIIVMDKGCILEEGTHEELIKNDGFYKKILDIQVSIEEEIDAETETIKN
ncbi:MAG: ABC transporter ATP-binding protein [Ignavibacteria bacterium]